MENENKKTSKKSLIVALIVIIIAALIAGYFVCTAKTKASAIFKSTIDESLSSLERKKEIDSLNTKMTLGLKLETEDENYKEISELLNNVNLSINLETDYKQKAQYIGLGVDYKGENSIKGNAYYADGGKELYLYVNDLFDKYFKLSLDDIDKSGKIKELLSALFEKTSKNDKILKGRDILKEKIKSKLKEEYFSQESVDGTKKSTLKLTFEQFKNIVKEICEELQKNEEFLACSENPTEVKDLLTKIVDGLNEKGKEYDKVNIEISLYTKGLLANEIVKFEASAYDEKESFKFTVNKVNNDNYDFNVKYNKNTTSSDVEILSGTVKIEKTGDNSKKCEISANVPDVGKIILSIEGTAIQNGELTKVDTSNSVNINELSEEDSEKIRNNLMKMPIFSYITGMFGVE